MFAVGEIVLNSDSFETLKVDVCISTVVGTASVIGSDGLPVDGTVDPTDIDVIPDPTVEC